MSDIALKVEDVSKLYRLGKISSGTLSHDLNRAFARLRGKEDPYSKIGEENDRSASGSSEYVWALKDISFDVKKGESLALIGKNGAGKSTLLKLLSRVTQPTTGNIYMKGRVASLLEVGTGFHPELTGRENIFLNGAILGMRKWEIKRKLDEIIAFSGVERYIDTPVKRYSSGMYVRLAFAVAAHLESEILIVDEVLAVGDAEFQKKCLGKMGEVSQGEGRTVLFVSHNMAAVKTLCNTGVLLEHGRLKDFGNVDHVVSKYLMGDKETSGFAKFTNPIIHDSFHIFSLGVKGIEKSYEDIVLEGEAMEVIMDYAIEGHDLDKYHVTFHLKNSSGVTLFSFSHTRDGVDLLKGRHQLICEFPKYFLNVGQYYLTLLVVKDKKKVIHEEVDVLTFPISAQVGLLGGWMGKEPGDLKPGFSWKII